MYRSNIQLAQDADRIARSLDEHSMLHIMDELTAMTFLTIKPTRWGYLKADCLAIVQLPLDVCKVIYYAAIECFGWAWERYLTWRYGR